MTSMDIRTGENVDFAALSVVAAAAYTHAYAELWSSPAHLSVRLQRFTPSALQAWAAEPDVRLFVPFMGEAPVGFMGLWARSANAVDGDGAAMELHRIYLLPNAIGRGFGRALLARAETEARASAAPALWLKSMADAPARKAYVRWGFRTIGEARLDNDLPARSAMVVMRKEIAA